MSRPFSAIVLFRDTPKERRYAHKSIPSIVALDPDEIIVGVDETRGGDFDQFLAGIFQKADYAKYRILSVSHNKNWRLHVAHVMFECYGAVKHKVAFTCNIDTVIKPSVLAAMDAMGKDNTGMISFSLKHKIRTIPDRIRWFYFQRQQRGIKTLEGTSGTYWIYLPYVLKVLNESEFMAVSNAFDSFLCHCFKDSPYSSHFWHDIGAHCMDYENNDLPWRQFSYGAWYGANCEKSYAASRPLKLIRRWLGPSVAMKIVYLRAAIRLLPEVWRTQYYGIWGGYYYSITHPGSEVVEAMRDVSYYEYSVKYGGSQVRKLKEWSRRGTGF